MTRNYRWTWTARIQKETLAALQGLAGSLGFIATRGGRYQGQPSPPDLLDALAACYVADPAGTQQALEVLLMAHDLLPDKPGAADADADAG